jgi:hypothetical protein
MDNPPPKGPRPRLAAGVVDAGIASAASFTAGLTGVRLLTDIDRGIYGVFFTAFLLGSAVTTQLILVPAQVVAVDLPRSQRLTVVPRSVFLAVIPALVTTTAALIAAAWTADLTSGSAIVALTVTTAATIALSPLQDHIRQLLHIAELSHRAVAVSCVQLAAVALAIGVLLGLDVPHTWIPFGSLALANLLSLGVGVVLAGGLHGSAPIARQLTFRKLTTSGKWLVVRAATPATLAFVAANILTRLAGPIAYGYAEAARQVAQPITVLAVGMMAVVGPQSVRAGALGDCALGASNRRHFIKLMLLGGIAYGAVTGLDWPLNPMAALVPAAYVVGGLVAATVVANLVAAVSLGYAHELLGAGNARGLAMISLIASPALPLAATAAGSIEAFARPLGYVLEGSIRVIGGSWLLRRHYRDRATDILRSSRLPSS